MPRTPKGHKRPADVTSNAVTKLPTGEDEEMLTEDGKNKAAVSLGRMGGLARAKALSAAQRKAIARTAAKARHKKAPR
jgi:hypothetical protein